ncbi:MAG: hypothetical protein A2Z04_06745 [Chloroflexi bacterium RBG_16_57_9]|nr:MAG: hypothetical protein A2Z04_06745 [Chloroflexi bacterium RBG_16_57_9]
MPSTSIILNQHQQVNPTRPGPARRNGRKPGLDILLVDDEAGRADHFEATCPACEKRAWVGIYHSRVDETVNFILDPNWICVECEVDRLQFLSDHLPEPKCVECEQPIADGEEHPRARYFHMICAKRALFN